MQGHRKVFNITTHQGNANENHVKIPPHACCNGYSRKDENEVRMRMRRKSPSAPLVGMQTGAAAAENRWRFLRKLNRAAIWPSNPTSECWAKGNENTQKDTRTPMFIAVLFTTAEVQKQPKRPLMGECVKKIDKAT